MSTRQIDNIAGNTLGMRLRLIRGAKNQKQFAEQFSISDKTLGRYERDERTPDKDFLSDVCIAYNLQTDWLLFGREPMYEGDVVFNNQEKPKVLNLKLIGLAACDPAGWYNTGPLALNVAVAADTVGQGAFAVLAVGVSMQPAGIFQGHVLICDPSVEYESNDIVFVKRTDGRVSIKKFLKQDDKWVYLRGWLEKIDKEGNQKPFDQQLNLDTVEQVCPVVMVKFK